MGNSVPDLVTTDKMIAELKINGWFGIGYHNLITYTMRKQSKVSAVILSCILKGLLLRKLKIVLSQSSRQKNLNRKGNCEKVKTFSRISQNPQRPSGEEPFLFIKQSGLDKRKQMQTNGKGKSVS